jgi:hypothetical protein
MGADKRSAPNPTPPHSIPQHSDSARQFRHPSGQAGSSPVSAVRGAAPSASWPGTPVRLHCTDPRQGGWGNGRQDPLSGWRRRRRRRRITSPAYLLPPRRICPPRSRGTCLPVAETPHSSVRRRSWKPPAGRRRARSPARGDEKTWYNPPGSEAPRRCCSTACAGRPELKKEEPRGCPLKVAQGS